MANNLVLPDALKSLKPYLTLATQLEQRNEKNIAYYCRLHAVQNGMSINKSAPECKKFLFQLMDLIEATKNQNKTDDSISNQVVGQAVFEKYALKIFEKADDDDRQSRFNKNLVKAFYSAGLLFDVLNYFGELSEDLVAKKQYAKRKAMYLNRCFQTGETPVPGPLLGEDNEENDGNDQISNNPSCYNENSNYNASQTNYSNTNDSNSPSNRPTSTINNYNKPNQPKEIPNAYNYQDSATAPPASESSLSPELLQKAQKHCKFATSALQYEDIPTAITNLEQCLKILKMGK